jgi:hypothetical protein
VQHRYDRWRVQVEIACKSPGASGLLVDGTGDRGWGRVKVHRDGWESACRAGRPGGRATPEREGWDVGVDRDVVILDGILILVVGLYLGVVLGWGCS